MKTHWRLKWDIFLSFQRETSHSFTDRLNEVLIKEHVRVWKCQVKRKNQVLGPSLVEAIEDSVAFIVVLSPDYAKSHWCLKELAKLCDLRSLGRPILPIFYEVDPWSFRRQCPFDMDFEEHSKKFGEEEIQRWREAMKIVGNISGYVENSVEEDLIELVVKSVLAQVSNTPEKVGEYSEHEWLTELEKLKSTQPGDLQALLALSFKSLGDEEKTVFLDIACLFLKMEIKKEEVIDVLKGCGFKAEAALNVLRQKSLVKFLTMGSWDHLSSIQGIVLDFKKKLARDPSAEEIAFRNLHDKPGIRSVFSYLKNKFVKFPAEEKPKSSEITTHVEPFVPMKKLRLLQINHVELEGDLKLLPSELKWIQWRGCPLKDVPPVFLARQLAVLDLADSGIRRVQSLHRKEMDGNLKVVNLRGCHSLEAIPDLSNHKSLEKLILERCMLLVKVPRSVGNLSKLLQLDFSYCSNLTEFLVDVSGLKSLEKLFLSGCSNLSVLPENIGMLASLEELNLTATALKNLPSSIGKLKNLQKLYLMHCASFSKLPDTINELKSLKKLFINGSAVEELPLNPGSLPSLTDFSAGGCKHLKQVPSSIGGLNSLLDLELDWTPIETLPKEIGGLHFIRKLVLRNCKSLKVLPESLGDMDTLHSLCLEGSNIEKLPESFGKLENLVLLRMNNCKKIKRLPESFGDLKSLHHLFMQETLVVELPESFGNLSKLVTLKMLKKPLFRSYARSWGIGGKIPDVLGKLSSLKILKLGNNYFHSLPSSLEGLLNLRELSLYDCRELKCLPPLPCNLEQLNLANCFSLESISDLSKLKILHELNLTNCKKVDDIPGLEHLKALKRLYMSGCKSKCSSEVKKRLSKASLKMMVNLSLPGNRIPVWFSQGPLRYTTQPNRELRGVILAVVVALNHERKDDYQLPDVVEVQAQILKLDLALYTHTLHLSGVPRTSDDQLHICRYSAMHPMVAMFKDGYTIQVTKREPPVKQGVELKMHGIHLVYEGDDDFKGEESDFTETQKLTNFFSTFEEGEASSKGGSEFT
ncbi:hypothetical protein YC2023_101511 [Brassica napus]